MDDNDNKPFDTTAYRWEIGPNFHHKMVVAARNLRRGTTKSEAILWTFLRRRQLAGIKFRRQQPIGPFIVDFYAAQERLVVEIDGPIHVSQLATDQERQSLLASLGINFVRLSSDLVERDLSEAISVIKAGLKIGSETKA